MHGLNRPFAGQNDRTLNHVAQLADVAGPIVGAEAFEHVRGDVGDLGGVLVVQILQQRLGEHRKILLPLTQRR